MLEKRNFRDLSTCQGEGLSLKPRSFFRSGKLYKLNNKEADYIASLGIKTILDLRSPEEIGEKADTPIPGVETIAIPFIKAEMFGITHEKKAKKKIRYKKPPHMPTLYRSLITSESTVEGLAKALSIIFDPNREGAILWHCTEGKDRAGILTAIFLKSLGFDDEIIFSDYEKTNRTSEKKGKRYRALIRLVMWNYKLAQAVYLAMKADREYLKEAHKAIDETYGSFSSFLHGPLGISEEDIETFKKKYVVSR